MRFYQHKLQFCRAALEAVIYDPGTRLGKIIGRRGWLHRQSVSYRPVSLFLWIQVNLLASVPVICPQSAASPMELPSPTTELSRGLQRWFHLSGQRV